MTGKQRAKLRSMANTTPSLYQIGKGGLTPEVQEQLDSALEARELIKVTVLESCPVPAQEALTTLSERLRAEPVQSIGRKITLYRRSKEKPKIELD
ncbi:MAG TPA: YhbY family RNA-binding protein [Clostridia bacterium]|nr:MAG: RNA-binding protein [Firmicutes bacterium ADurb.Bin248]HOG00509.1 YhbY family RNA-binding protein [Clostridia bacterium]HOS18005.1 YhbY family RNA-binding protein [Clostridia bacterium]HPK14821.1 YhbY family RNA-binding protein [Clostridia bacterium]